MGEQPTSTRIVGISGSITAEIVHNHVHFSQPRSPPRCTSFFQVDCPVQHFEGRVKLMDTIHSRFQSCVRNAEVMNRTVALTGIGGIGKSELARKFVMNYRANYPNVAWISSATERELMTSFKKLGRKLGLVTDSSDEEPKDYVERIYEYIDKYCPGPTLLVFDNVEHQPGSSTEQFDIQEYLPGSQALENRPLILMTCRTQDLIDKCIPSANLIPVDALEESEALNFLSRFFELKSEEDMAKVQERLRELNHLLQGYPIALTVAAGQIESGLSIEDLDWGIKTFIESVYRELGALTDQKGNRFFLTKYPHTMEAVWAVTVERIRNHAKAHDMIIVLRALAFIEPDFIEEREVQNVIGCWCPYVESNHDFLLRDPQRGVRGALLALAKLCVLRIVPKESSSDDVSYYRIHRLIRRLARKLDDHNVGASRALYYSLDFEPPFIYSGCSEHLIWIIDGKVAIEERLKQLYLAAMIVNGEALPSDVFLKAVEHFEAHAGTERATEHLLLMLDAIKSRVEPAAALALCQKVEQVMDAAIEWYESTPQAILMQACATNAVLTLLYKHGQVLSTSTCTREMGQKLMKWMEIQLNIRDKLAEKHITQNSVVDACTYRIFGAAIHVREQSEFVASAGEFVAQLINRNYESCAEIWDHRDGWWHILSGCLRLEGCRESLRNHIDQIVKNAVDTLRRSNEIPQKCVDGIYDCLLFMALVPDYVLACCEHEEFLKQLLLQVKVRLNSPNWEKNVYLGLFVISAWMKAPRKVEMAFLLCFGLEDFKQVKVKFDEIMQKATRLYRRWRPVMGDVFGGFQNGNQFLVELKEFAESTAPPRSFIETIFREEILKFFAMFEKNF